MKTQKILIFFSIFLLSAFFISCEDFLEIDPQQSVDDEAVYTTHEGVVNVLNGVYERVAGPQLYAGTSVLQSELIGNSGDLNWIGTFIQYRQWNWKSMDPNDGFIAAKWLRSYQAIDLINNVLENLSIVNEDSRARVEGEAKFLRGILYFELVRFYALPYVDGQANDHLGVPIILTPTTPETVANDLPGRATVAQVYQQILVDLNQAKQLLEVVGTGAGANGGRATSTTSSAFLAKVHMAMEQWEMAAEEADIVIQAFGGYDALHENPRDAFNNDSYTSEDVFMIVQNEISNVGQANDGITTFFASLPGLGRGDVYVADPFLELFEPGDLRAEITDGVPIGNIQDVTTMLYIGVGTDSGNLMTAKWGKHDANIPVIRLAEMILTRGEANFRNGSSIGADPLDDFNAIRDRSNASMWDDLTLEMIEQERFRELAFEGHRLHDLRRFRGSVVAPSGSPYVGETLQWNDPRLVMPIPQREMDVNPNLVQNPAYVN